MLQQKKRSEVGGTFNPADFSDVSQRDVLKFMGQHLGLYPKDFFKQIGLRKIVVYGNTENNMKLFTTAGHFKSRRVRFFIDKVSGGPLRLGAHIVHHEIAHAVTVHTVTEDEWVAATYGGDSVSYDRTRRSIAA
jgi:hypothetical protein